MTLRELAHSAHQHLQTVAGLPVKRSHVHELLAAAFGYSSWAAFCSESLLADAGVGDALAGTSPQLIGRAVQLGYGQAASVLLADALVAFAVAWQVSWQVSCVRWADVREALAAVPVLVDENRLDDEDEDWDDEDEAPQPAPIAGPDPQRFLSSPLLLDSLEQMAEGAEGEVHQVLATLYRCKRPNPYLHDESLKGRRPLTRIEQGWVDEYLLAEPRFRKYEALLKAAALGGVRPAAAEYAAVFDSLEFFELAERMAGDVDADRMAQIAATPDTGCSMAADCGRRWVRFGTADACTGRLRLGAGAAGGARGHRRAARRCRACRRARRPDEGLDLAAPGVAAWRGLDSVNDAGVSQRWAAAR